MKIPKPKALSNRYWPQEKELFFWDHSFFWQCVTYVSFFVSGVYLRFFFVFRFVFFGVCFLHHVFFFFGKSGNEPNRDPSFIVRPVKFLRSVWPHGFLQLLTTEDSTEKHMENKEKTTTAQQAPWISLTHLSKRIA